MSVSTALKFPLIAGALGVSFISLPSVAQTYDDNGYNGGYYGPPRGEEEVIIQAPRYHGPSRSTIGAPIRDVGMSQPVRYDDLDLRTYDGVRELRERIRYTARTLCHKLDVAYPISVSDSPDCYRSAMADAMDQADAAIDRARGEDDARSAY